MPLPMSLLVSIISIRNWPLDTTARTVKTSRATVLLATQALVVCKWRPFIWARNINKLLNNRYQNPQTGLFNHLPFLYLIGGIANHRCSLLYLSKYFYLIRRLVAGRYIHLAGHPV